MPTSDASSHLDVCVEDSMTTRKATPKPPTTGDPGEDEGVDKLARDLRTVGKQQLEESLARERARQRAGSDD